MSDILEEGKRTGEIASAASVEDAVLGIVAIHDGNMLLWYRSGCHPVMGRKLALAARHLALQQVHGISADREPAPKPDFAPKNVRHN